MPEVNPEDEPWRVFNDVDIEVPGDRLNKRGMITDGPNVFRWHWTQNWYRDEPCHNDWGWGSTYRHVQTILSLLFRRRTPKHVLTTDVPSLPEITLAMGAGNAWVPPPAVEGEQAEDDEDEAAEKREFFRECAVAEPHDVAEYFRAHHPEICGATRLLTFQTREGATLLSNRTSLLETEHTYEIWDRPPGTYEIGSPEAVAEAQRIRELLACHLERTEMPILIDDSVNSYLITGYREMDPDGPFEECPVQYRIIDAQYGLRYALRRHDFIFDPENGQDQLGVDKPKDQWINAEWVEEGRGLLNGYIAGPMWMVLLMDGIERRPDLPYHICEEPPKETEAAPAETGEAPQESRDASKESAQAPKESREASKESA